MPATMMETGFVRCMSIRWKVFGPYCVLGYDLIADFLKSSYRFISLFLNLRTILDDGLKHFYPHYSPFY